MQGAAAAGRGGRERGRALAARSPACHWRRANPASRCGRQDVRPKDFPPLLCEREHGALDLLMVACVEARPEDLPLFPWRVKYGKNGFGIGQSLKP